MHDGQHSLDHGLGRQAAGLELVVVLATVTLVAALGQPVPVERGDWIAFGVLLPLAAIAHLLGADRTKHQGSQLSLAPIFAAVLILPPSLTTLLIALAVIPESLRRRTDWYILVFNVCNLVAPALLARAVFDAVESSASAGWTVGAGLAIVAFLILHYGLLATVLRLARGVKAADTVRLDCVLIDAGLLSLGAIAAALWSDYPGLVGLTLLPLALAYRSLAIPALVEATRIEPKTGLYNLRHFEAALGQELGRAGRFDRPIAILMIDVDQLREINTAHGHMAGDRTLVGVAASSEAGDAGVRRRSALRRGRVLRPASGNRPRRRHGRRRAHSRAGGGDEWAGVRPGHRVDRRCLAPRGGRHRRGASCSG